MVQAFSRSNSTVIFRVPSMAILCEIYGGRSGIETGSSPRTLDFPCPYLSSILIVYHQHYSIMFVTDSFVKWRGTNTEEALGVTRNLQNSAVLFKDRGRDSSVGIATRYGLNGPGIESRWGRDFPHRQDRPWGPPSLLYSGYRVFLGGGELNWLGCGVDHTPPSNAEVEGRVELYICSPSGPSWPLIG